MADIKNKTVYILMGPSGSGKTTLGEYLKDMGIPELVSHTTRPPRKGEVEGISYYFVSDEEFDQLNKIEESPYSGKHRYCLSQEELDKQFAAADKVFSIMDRVGAEEMRNKLPQGMVKVIYVDISLDDMLERMTNRGDDPEAIAERIAHAKNSNEFANREIADYVIQNKNTQLLYAFEDLCKIVAA